MKKILSKRTLSLLLAVLFIVPLMFLATACGENDANVAKVSTYDELVEALSGDKEIVRLEKDIDVEDALIITRAITLDMNGKTLYNTNDIWVDEGGPWSILSVDANGDLTIKGNGKVKTKENDCYVAEVVNGGKLTIENGEFIGNIAAIYAYEGNVEIKGGTYSIKQLNNNGVEGPYGQTINIYNQNGENGTATVEITGGTFKNFDPCNKSDNHDKLVANGYKSELIEGTNDYKVVKAS